MPVSAKYTPEQLAQAVKLTARGWTHERVAARQGVARETVSRHLSEHRRQSLSRLRADGAALLAEQDEQLQNLIFEAWREWGRSRRDAQTTTETRHGDELSDPGPDGESIEVLEAKIKRLTKVEGRLGDPRYLREIRELLAERRELLGLDSGVSASDDGQPPRIVIPDRDDRFDGPAGGRPPEAGDRNGEHAP